MKKLYFFSVFVLLIFNSVAQENTLHLKSGKISLSSDINIFNVYEKNYHFMIFSHIPTNLIKEKIKLLGIDFLYYIPNKAYVVSISKEINVDNLANFGIIAVNPIQPSNKIDPKLQGYNLPDWAFKNNMLSIKLLLYKNANLLSFEQYCQKMNYQIDAVNRTNNSILLTVSPNELSVLSTNNEVWYIEPIDPPSKKENKTGRTLHRSNVINTNYFSGRHYDGSGINIMMQDDGIIGPHIDYQGRIDQSNCGGCSTSNSNDHGDHVAGTIMGAGNLDPIAAGMSNASFLYVYGSSNNNYYDVPLIYQNNDVIITSKSYSNGCNAGYTSLARDLDEQINLYPSLIHIFSAGNDGGSNCGYGAGSGWGNVTGGHKQAKNVIAVANLTSSGSLASSSSRGPAADGRIKPDIGAKGSSVNSTIPDNNYGLKTGTSMSCPGIAGVMAQLYQAYKELNSGQNPNSSIMKNVLLNSADDIGNPGPDFKHGWGQVNILRAVTMIEDNQYFLSNIDQGSTNTHSISIPSGTKQLKLMVYWHDKEGSANANPSLVNDLDIELFDNFGNSVELPWVLDPTPNSTLLNSNAIKGTDHLNNMEQITMDNPVVGNYNLVVSGNSIPFGPQEYSVSYVFINDDITLTYPVGGEGWVAGESEIVRWDAYGNTGNFTLEYSIDGGLNWIGISSNINGSNRQFVLTSVPNIISDNVKFRISRNGIFDESDATLTIIDVPTNLSVYWPCPDSLNVSWSAVNGATSYEVSMLGQQYMDSIYTTNNTNVWIINPNPNIVDSWFSVRSIYNNSKGRRAIAIQAQSINSICAGYGCTDPTALNYDPTAIVNNGSCCYIAGCMDVTAINYDSTACFDNGSCIAPILGCTNPNAQNFDPNANTTIAYGGALDNLIGGGSYFNGDQHLNFDAIKECIIRSAIIYAEAANTITFELRNSAGSVIDDTTLSVVYGPQRIPLNFDVPIGLDMQLGVSQGSLQSDGLYRNNSGPTYPYDIASAINITSSSASSDPFGYYYFYYDIEVESPCDLTGITSWDCDGLGNCYDPGTGNGQYTSLVSCQSNCILPSWDCDGLGNCYDPGTGNGQYSSLSNCELECVNVIIDEYRELDFNIYPNPTNSECIINSSKNIEKLQIFDVSARLCISMDFYSNKIILDVSTLSPGVYTIELITAEESVKRQLIIQ